MYEIIDNFLDDEDFLKIKNLMLDPNFSWKKTPIVPYDKEYIPLSASYYFYHAFWLGFDVSPDVKLFSPLLSKIDCKSVLRIKGNLYPCTEKVIHHMDHSDYSFSHRAAIFYINTNNGFTVVNGEKVESIENRILLFDPSVLHHSTTCSDNTCRLNVNINFF